MTLIEELEKASQGFDGILGVSIKNLDTGEEAGLNSGTLFPAASVFKVPVLIELFRQVDAGELDLEESVILRSGDRVPGSGVLKEMSEGLKITVKDLARLMMTVSDNTATDLIIKLVGKDRVNETISDLGLEETVVMTGCREILFDLVGLDDLPDEEKTIERFMEAAGVGEMDGTWSLGVEENNVTTPEEMMMLLKMIVRGEAASREGCDMILDIMSRCQTGRYRLAKYLPSQEISLIHKTGSLPGIRNDVGVVTVKDYGERYIISCFTKEASDVYEAEEVIALTSEHVYNYLNMRNKQ
ncbi:MAG: serine hydrolase [Candidatus Bathyarchaeia archaeon]